MGKSKATKPTRRQKELMEKAGLIVCNWLVLKENDRELCLVSRMSGAFRHIKKGPSLAG